MPTIKDPRLEVDPVPGKPGQRRIHVSYELELTEADLTESADLVERAVVRGSDLHDSPTRPQPLAVEIEERRTTGQPGPTHRELSRVVNRVDLDVQQDWWRTDHGGGVEPIAEMPDHLVAEIAVTIAGQVVAEATTPVVTGSWGALGED